MVEIHYGDGPARGDVEQRDDAPEIIQRSAYPHGKEQDPLAEATGIYYYQLVEREGDICRYRLVK